MIHDASRFYMVALSLIAALLIAGCTEDESSPTIGEPPPAPIIDPADSSMVIVPEGYAVLGNYPEGWGNYETAQNPTWIDSFSMDRYEVTNLQFADYLDSAIADSVIFYLDGDIYDERENGHLLLQVTSPYCHIAFVGDTLQYEFDAEEGYEQMPVVMVTWHGAAAYAEYIGKRLPTEAEWERAARGNSDAYGSLDGAGVGFIYPWGGSPPDADLANFGNPNGAPDPVNTNSAGISWFGAFCMAGNVAEWTSTALGSTRVHRGGSFSSGAELLRTGWRSFADPATAYRGFGFRCARD